MRRWFRDWRRGYTDADLEWATRFLASGSNHRPGVTIWVAPGELKAVTALQASYWFPSMDERPHIVRGGIVKVVPE